MDDRCRRCRRSDGDQWQSLGRATLTIETGSIHGGRSCAAACGRSGFPGGRPPPRGAGPADDAAGRGGDGVKADRGGSPPPAFAR